MNLPRLGTAAVIIDHDSILLGKRNKSPELGKWVLPGGKIEPFETIEDALKREIKEETGLKVNVIRQIHTFEKIDKDSGEHRVIIYQLAEIVNGQIKPSGDTSDIKFFKKDELNNIEITEFVKNVLRFIDWY